MTLPKSLIIFASVVLLAVAGITGLESKGLLQLTKTSDL